MSRDDRVLPLTRALAVLIVPILTIAFVMLWVYPARSGELFAWPVKPAMTAMMLGATYLGGAWFFGRVLFARAWHTVTLGFIPVTVFAAILGLATVVHWPLFTPGHPSFVLWAILYLTLPFAIPVAWWRNARRDPGRSVGPRSLVAGPPRLVVAVLGAVMSVTAAILVLSPESLIDAWPWTLSPLSARVLGAMFALSGAVGIGISIDRRPRAARAIVEAQALAIGGILLGLLRSANDVSLAQPAIWLFVLGLAAVLGANAYVAYRTPEPAPGTNAVA